MLVKLKDISKVVGGATPSTQVSEYYNGNIVWITPKDLADNKSNKYIDCGERNITKLGFEKSNTHLIPPNNILISTRAPIGYMAINRKECCTNQGFKSLICNTNLVNVDFLYYYLKTKIKALESLGTGTTFKEVSKEAVENFEIDLPALKIQDKIANILSNIDNQIERNNAMTKRLQVMGNTIYSNHAKTQKDTFNIQEKAEIIWGQCPLGENLLENSNEKSIKYASGAGDIDDNITSVIPKGFTDNPLRIAKEKDICISVAGTVGKIGIATEDIAIGRAMLSIRNSDLYGYLYFALNTYKDILSKQATGAIQKIINNSHLEIIDIPIENKEIVNTLNHILDEIIRIEKNTKELNILKNKLLPLLINGQLEV